MNCFDYCKKMADLLMTITYQCRFIQGRSTVLTKCNFGLFGVLLCSGVEVVIKDLGDCNEKVGDCNVD